MGAMLCSTIQAVPMGTGRAHENGPLAQNSSQLCPISLPRNSGPPDTQPGEGRGMDDAGLHLSGFRLK